MSKILLCVALHRGLEFWVVFTDQGLEHVWFNTILAILNLIFLFFGLTFILNFFGFFLFGISTAHQSINELGDLAH